MAINIKNSEAEKLARKLARLTGETMSGAVTVALRERLDRLASAGGHDLAGRLVQIGKECAAHLREPSLTVDHGDLLYDDKGLPR